MDKRFNGLTPFQLNRTRFFYKYDPLLNVFVKNKPFQILLPNLAWWKVQKVTRITSRHRVWRSRISTMGHGGRHIPPLHLAVGWQDSSIRPSQWPKVARH
jgi:hypothetical protein